MVSNIALDNASLYSPVNGRYLSLHLSPTLQNNNFELGPAMHIDTLLSITSSLALIKHD